MSVNARGKRDGRKVHAVTKRPAPACGRCGTANAGRRCGGGDAPTPDHLDGPGRGIAVVASAFFASAGITHWVMSLRHTVVVVRPGPTVYLPRPAGHGHSHDRVAPAPAPAVPAYDGGLPLRQDTGARPDHRGAHARGHRRGAHARRHRGGAHAWAHRRGAHTWPDHGKWHHKNQGQAQHIIAAEAMATITVAETRPGERASYPLDRNRLVH